VSGVPYSSRPVSEEMSINTAQQSNINDASRLPQKRSNDVTGGGQSASEANLDMLIDRYGRVNTHNLPADSEPRSEEVQQLIKV